MSITVQVSFISFVSLVKYCSQATEKSSTVDLKRLHTPVKMADFCNVIKLNQGCLYRYYGKCSFFYAFGLLSTCKRCQWKWSFQFPEVFRKSSYASTCTFLSCRVKVRVPCLTSDCAPYLCSDLCLVAQLGKGCQTTVMRLAVSAGKTSDLHTSLFSWRVEVTQDGKCLPNVRTNVWRN